MRLQIELLCLQYILNADSEARFDYIAISA